MLLKTKWKLRLHDISLYRSHNLVLKSFSGKYSMVLAPAARVKSLARMEVAKMSERSFHET